MLFGGYLREKLLVEGDAYPDAIRSERGKQAVVVAATVAQAAATLVECDSRQNHHVDRRTGSAWRVFAGLREAERTGDQFEFVTHEVQAQHAGRLDARVGHRRAAGTEAPDRGCRVDLVGQRGVRQHHAHLVQFGKQKERVGDLLGRQSPFARGHAVAPLARSGTGSVFRSRYVVVTHRQPTPNAVMTSSATVREMTTTTVVHPMAL